MQRKVRGREILSISGDVYEMMRKRDEFKAKANKTKEHEAYQLCKTIKNKINRTLSNNQMEYYNYLITKETK